jgi:hypothetical protein
MNENEELIHGLQLNNIEQDKIAALIELKEAAAKLGWTLDNYDEAGDGLYVTFAIFK